MIRALIVMCSVYLAGASWAPAQEPGSALPLGVQQCDTKCQTTFTDCMLACDGEPKCQTECRSNVEACVSACKLPVAEKPKP